MMKLEINKYYIIYLEKHNSFFVLKFVKTNKFKYKKYTFDSWMSSSVNGCGQISRVMFLKNINYNKYNQSYGIPNKIIYSIVPIDNDVYELIKPHIYKWGRINFSKLCNLN